MTVVGLLAAFFITSCLAFIIGRRSVLMERNDDDLCGWEGTDGGDD